MTSFDPEQAPATPPPAAPQPAAPQVQQQYAPPPSWGWARPQEMRAVETEPLEYHRLLRGTAKYRWWKPLVMLLIAASLYFIMNILLGLLLGPFLLIFDPDYLTIITTGDGDMLDTQHPLSVLLSLLSIALMIPAVLVAMLSMGMRPLGRVWSVAARMRWGLLLRSCGNALVAVVVMNAVGIGVSFLLDPASFSEEASSSSATFDANAALLSLLFIVLLVPFQSAAEEMVFRGLFMQVLGSWLRNKWFAIGIPSVAFALAHIYDIWGMLAVGAMGAVAAWLAWRTGGIEAAIAIHVINNLIAFGLMTAGFGGETAQVEESGGPSTLIGEIAGLAVFIWLTLRTFRKGRHGRTRIDVQWKPVPVPEAAVPSEPRSAGAPEGGAPGA